MKLIIAIVQTADSADVANALLEQGFRVTKLASTGGFLRRGSTTMLIGVEDDQVEEVINTIKNSLHTPSEPAVKQGAVFVLPVSRFEQI